MPKYTAKHTITQSDPIREADSIRFGSKAGGHHGKGHTVDGGVDLYRALDGAAIDTAADLAPHAGDDLQNRCAAALASLPMALHRVSPGPHATPLQMIKSHNPFQ